MSLNELVLKLKYNVAFLPVFYIMFTMMKFEGVWDLSLVHFKNMNEMVDTKKSRLMNGEKPSVKIPITLPWHSMCLSSKYYQCPSFFGPLWLLIVNFFS